MSVVHVVQAMLGYVQLLVVLPVRLKVDVNVSVNCGACGVVFLWVVNAVGCDAVFDAPVSVSLAVATEGHQISLGARMFCPDNV